jgi:lipopolysaccharide export system protein LptA
VESAYAVVPDDDTLEVTADHSLEWYQDKNLYVARGNAKAVRGDKEVAANTLTAHERADAASKKASKDKANNLGKVDYLTAEGNVVITDPLHRITGEHGIYDLDQGLAKLTGSNLKYETEKETVTARDSLEYWENTKMAVARGKAVAVGSNRRVEADVLTAQFLETHSRSGAQTRLSKLIADGNVNVITSSDLARGDRGVYDMDRNVATLMGHVRITRADGTQLNGDRGEVDFNTNQSRLLNSGQGGRVRVLLPAHGKPKTAQNNVQAIQ